MLVIKWNSSPTCAHKAKFAKSIVGIRVVVETYHDSDECPARVETGQLGVMLSVLLNPAGRYRLEAGTLEKFESQIESLFDAEVATPEPRVHPTFAPFLSAFAPAGSVYARGSLT